MELILRQREQRHCDHHRHRRRRRRQWYHREQLQQQQQPTKSLSCWYSHYNLRRIWIILACYILLVGMSSCRRAIATTTTIATATVTNTGNKNIVFSSSNNNYNSNSNSNKLDRVIQRTVTPTQKIDPISASNINNNRSSSSSSSSSSNPDKNNNNKPRFLRYDNDYYMLDRTDDVDCDDDDRHYYDTSSKEPSLGVPSPSATTDSPTESDPLWWESSIDNLVKKFDQDFTDISKNEDKDEDKEENGIENENIATVLQPTPPLPHATYNADALLYALPNSVAIDIKVGLVHYNQLIDDEKKTVVMMCLRTMTVVLNESDIPFVISDEDSFDGYLKNKSTNDLQRRGLFSHKRYENSSFLNPSSSSSVYDQQPQQLEEQRQRQQSKRNYDDDDDNAITNVIVNDDVVDTSMEEKEEEEETILRLVLTNVTIGLSKPEYSFRDQWWKIQAIYTVLSYPRRSSSPNGNRSRNRSRNGSRNGNGNGNGNRERDNNSNKQPQQKGGHHEIMVQPTIPVVNEKLLNKIEYICDKTMDAAIQNKQFWATLLMIEFGDQNLVLDRPYYTDDKGLADCMEDEKDQYDFSPFFCPGKKTSAKGNRRSIKKNDYNASAYYNNDNMCGTDGGNVSTPVSVDTPNSLYNSSTNTTTCREGIADSPFHVVWTTREWFGLGLMVTTIVVVVSLSSIAHIISERRTRQQLWGTALTKEGVDDILQVGWRYHEQQQQQQNQIVHGDGDGDTKNNVNNPPNDGSPQLFLQIYDKGFGPGYNDGNSMLKGGVERIEGDYNYIHSGTIPPVSTTAPTISSIPPPCPPMKNSNINTNNIPPPYEPFRPQYPE